MTSGARRVDELLGAAGIDPAAGLQIASTDRLPGLAFDPSLPLLLLAATGPPADPLPGRHARSGVRALLSSLYPPDHALRRLPSGVATPLAEVAERDLLVGDWLLEPVGVTENLASPHGMAAISARLRAPDGCPWDRAQTHLTLRPYLLEEAYEALDAIERGTPGDLAEELGDLLLQVILHAQLAAEEGEFDLTDVYRSIGAKIVRRHPHVFGETVVDGVAQVLSNWETIKAGERAERGKGTEGAFTGVARALPALPASREIQERASALGWDWQAIDGVWDKVAEELDELRAAGSPEARLHELGDVLFALVNLGRWMKVDAEEALRAANHRWVARHERVEALARERGVDLAALSLAEKDELWDEVKGR